MNINEIYPFIVRGSMLDIETNTNFEFIRRFKKQKSADKYYNLMVQKYKTIRIVLVQDTEKQLKITLHDERHTPNCTAKNCTLH